MIVVSDTSALTSLLQVKRADILERLYGIVLIPPAVETELRVIHATLPPFIQVVPVQNQNEVAKLLSELHAGEAHARYWPAWCWFAVWSVKISIGSPAWTAHRSISEPTNFSRWRHKRLAQLVAFNHLVLRHRRAGNISSLTPQMTPRRVRDLGRVRCAVTASENSDTVSPRIK